MPAAGSCFPLIQERSRGCAGHEYEHTRGISAALSGHTGPVHERYIEINEHENMKRRAHLVGPFEFHPQPVQVSGNEIAEPNGHTGSGQAQNQNRAKIVERTEPWTKPGL